MSKKQIPFTQKTCTNSIGVYYRAMETKDFVFFVNFNESDENGQVKMYKKDIENNKLNLVSDNYFAVVGINEEFQEENETWTSSAMKKEREIIIEEVILPLVKEYVKLSRKGDAGERFSKLEEEIGDYYITLPEMDVCAFLETKFNL